MTHTKYIFLLLVTSTLLLATPVSCTKAPEKKTVLITGAAGFIGSNFLQYMFDKYPSYHFLVLDLLTYAGNLNNIPDYIKRSGRYEFFHGSITNPELVDELTGRSQLIVHFAAESHVTKSLHEDIEFFETDVMGSRVMMAALVKHSHTVERFIHISTSEVLGTAEYTPMDEEHPLNPRTPYAAAKAGADRLVYAYWCSYDIPAVIVRPFNNYGPRQHIEKMIPRFITNALCKKPIVIHGSGLQTRDWIHTLDVARALDAILHTPHFETIRNQVLHIGSGIDTSVLDIAKEILRHFNLPEEEYLLFVEDRSGKVDCHKADVTKATKLLNWKPQVSLNEGLAQTIDWYTNNRKMWKNQFVHDEFLLGKKCLPQLQ